jgi:tetratricopeptide (TPR) repeat protein
MKKVIVTILAGFCTVATLFAQEEGLTWGMVKTSTEKIDEQIKDAEKAAKPATWMERGRIYTNLFEFDVKNLFYGMKESDITLVKASAGTGKRTEGEMSITSYDRVEIYTKLDKKTNVSTLEKWVYTDEVRKARPEPIYTAYEAYMKAKELDPEGKLNKKLKEKLNVLKDGNHLLSVGLFYYGSGDFASCLKYFEAIQSINDLPFINVTDTNGIINCGVMAMKAKNMDKAKKYFGIAADRKIGGAGLFMDICKIYKESGDTAGAIETLKKGIDKYPKEASPMITEMVNIYLATGKNKEAMEYLTKAIELQPSNATYHFALGALYDQMKQQDKAIESYQKAIAIDPLYVDAYLNAGASYYNAGIEHFKIASDPKSSNTVYESEKKIALDLYAKAVPFLEKVKEVSKNKKEKIDALFSLKQIYYKLGQKEKSDKAKAEYEAIAK